MRTINNTISTPLKQAASALREVADAMQHGEAEPRWQVDKIARILAGALVNIDSRLSRLEQYQQDCEAEDTAFGVQQEGRHG